MSNWPEYAEAQAEVLSIMNSPQWPEALRQLTPIIDTEGIGGITTEQIVRHFMAMRKAAKS